MVCLLRVLKGRTKNLMCSTVNINDYINYNSSERFYKIPKYILKTWGYIHHLHQQIQIYNKLPN